MLVNEHYPIGVLRKKLYRYVLRFGDQTSPIYGTVPVFVGLSAAEAVPGNVTNLYCVVKTHSKENM